MADPADIGPQYQCDECGVWSPDTTCVQCGAELGEDVRGVPVVFGKSVVVEGVVPAAPNASVTGGEVAYIIDCKVTIDGVDLDESNYACLVEKTDKAIWRAAFGAPKKDGNQ